MIIFLIFIPKKFYRVDNNECACKNNKTWLIKLSILLSAGVIVSGCHLSHLIINNFFWLHVFNLLDLIVFTPGIFIWMWNIIKKNFALVYDNNPGDSPHIHQRFSAQALRILNFVQKRICFWPLIIWTFPFYFFVFFFNFSPSHNFMDDSNPFSLY